MTREEKISRIMEQYGKVSNNLCRDMQRFRKRNRCMDPEELAGLYEETGMSDEVLGVDSQMVKCEYGYRKEVLSGESDLVLFWVTTQKGDRYCMYYDLKMACEVTGRSDNRDAAADWIADAVQSACMVLFGYWLTFKSFMV